ncbi:MAG: dipeptidase [Anaerolineae bacterium]|nr:dipeptidase [Anaerolineae bacterium]
MQVYQKALDYARSHYDQFTQALISFTSIQSVSTDPERKRQVIDAARWLATKLELLECSNVQIIPTNMHPVVYGEKMIDSKLPTVLVYGHYDVQPEDPVSLWNTDSPFKPVLSGDMLIARGVTDMKGQVMAGLAAIESIMAVDQTLPVNVKFIYEGEEEIGSPSIHDFLMCHRELLRADIVLNLDAGMLAPDIPTITYALRGLSYYELTIFGPKTDLHSGIFGGIIDNPAMVLCKLLSAMKDENSRICLPDFYNDVVELTESDRIHLRAMPQTDDVLLEQTGVPKLKGETGYSRVEQNTARPTLDIHGLLSGFTGKGAKTVIPSWAMAKFSMRTVPNQTPAIIDDQLRSFIAEHAPDTVTWELKTYKGGYPAYCDPSHPATQAMSAALAEAWGTDPVFKREGASIPIVTEMQNILGMDSVLSGFALPTDNMHAPNETLNLEVWKKGIAAVIAFFYIYGKSAVEKKSI